MNLHLNTVIQKHNNPAEYSGKSSLAGIALILTFIFICMGSRAQTISLNKKRMTAEKVITAVQEQSGYNVLYASALLDEGRKTDVSLDKATLTEALDVVVSKQPYTYELIGKTIVLRSREEKKNGSALNGDDPKQEEMVSNGYQTMSKKQSTGSFGQVSREEIERNSSTSILDQLRKLPGVTVTGNSIVIRGINTMYGSTDPLILLDGVTYPAASINTIDPNMVQNITVLKDSETSMYGSRGANGVILITTRRGGKQDQVKKDPGSIRTNKDGSVLLNRVNVTVLMTAISQWYQLRLTFEGRTPQGDYSGRLTKDTPLSEMIYILQAAGIPLKQDGKNIVINAQ